MTTNEEPRTSAGELVPASTQALLARSDGLNEVAAQLVETARADGIALTGDGGLLPALLKKVLETDLAAELGDHLGYQPHAAEGRNSGNSRNGSFPKTVTTEVGEVALQIPRDRAGTKPRRTSQTNLLVSRTIDRQYRTAAPETPSAPAMADLAVAARRAGMAR